MEDIAGRRFGRLVAAKMTDRTAADGTKFWICYCDCGASTAASYGALMRGDSVSCGCESLIGKRFGWLTVLDVRHGRAACRCDCGTEVSLERSRLNAHTSCGCASGRRAYIDGQVSLFPAENALAW